MIQVIENKMDVYVSQPLTCTDALGPTRRIFRVHQPELHSAPPYPSHKTLCFNLLSPLLHTNQARSGGETQLLLPLNSFCFIVNSPNTGWERQMLLLLERPTARGAFGHRWDGRKMEGEMTGRPKGQGSKRVRARCGASIVES